MRFAKPVLSGLIAGVLISAGVCPLFAADRVPVPDAEKVEESRKLIRELFKKEYASRSKVQQAMLGTKLLKQAGESKNDLPARFALLEEAQEIAAKSGDAVTAMKATDEMILSFEVPRGKTWAKIAGPMLSAANNSQKARDLAILFQGICNAALDENDIDSALSLARTAESAARRARNVSILKSARELKTRITRLKADAEKVEKALQVLKTNPVDETANLTVGKYYCLQKLDWGKGIPYLALGSDKKLKAAALVDKKAVVGDAKDKLAAGEEWYNVAKSLPKDDQTPFQERAYYWYQAALPMLESLQKLQAQKRMEELQPVVAAGSNLKWADIRRAVTKKDYNKERIVGGAFTKETFEEIPPGGAILIGFKCAATKDGRYPAAVQAIYQTPAGEVLGRGFGKLERGQKLLTVKAKPGYAVGAVFTRGGGGFDAFKPIFMKIKGNGLDPNDQYDGPHIGGKGGSSGTLGGNGGFIIGLHGKVDKKGSIGALSIVTLNNGPPTIKKRSIFRNFPRRR